MSFWGTSKKKRGRQDVLPMRVDLEAVAAELEFEKSKLAVLSTNEDETSPWHPSANGKGDYVDGTGQDDSRIPQMKVTRHGMNTPAIKPLLQKHNLLRVSQRPVVSNGAMPATSSHPALGPMRDDALGVTCVGSTLANAPERRQTRCTTSVVASNELFAPPSYSAANRLGGILSNVADIEVLKECRSRVEVNNESTAVRSLALQSTGASSLPRSSLDTITGIAVPLASPARSESCMSMATPASYSSSSSIRHIKNDLQISFTHASSTAGCSKSPMLMIVVSTFVPNLEDELSIQVGETVCMLEEFKDGWCTVQYGDKRNSARGVVPRICLRERSIFPFDKLSASSPSRSNSFHR